MSEWENIKGYEGRYEINKKGQVRSLLSPHETPWKKGPKILTPKKQGKKGYLGYCLSKGHASFKYKYIHRLVAETFLEKKAEEEEVNHKDFNKANNNIENLEWVTRSANHVHAHMNNRHIGTQKITYEDAQEIRRLYKTGEYSQSVLGRAFDIPQTNVSRIVLGKQWNPKVYDKL